MGNPNWVRGGPSPNPGGRPKAPPAYTGADREALAGVALDVLAAIARNRKNDPRTRAEAAKTMLAYLRPPSAPEANAERPTPRDLAAIAREREEIIRLSDLAMQK